MGQICTLTSAEDKTATIMAYQFQNHVIRLYTPENTPGTDKQTSGIAYHQG